MSATASAVIGWLTFLAVVVGFNVGWLTLGDRRWTFGKQRYVPAPTDLSSRRRIGPIPSGGLPSDADLDVVLRQCGAVATVSVASGVAVGWTSKWEMFSLALQPIPGRELTVVIQSGPDGSTVASCYCRPRVRQVLFLDLFGLVERRLDRSALDLASAVWQCADRQRGRPTSGGPVG